MYREYSINLIYKIIGLLLFLLIIVFINNIYVLTILFLSAILLNKNANPLLFLSLLFTFLFLVLKYIDCKILIVNVFLIIDYIIIFFINVKKEEFILLKKMFLNKKFMYKDLNKNYIKDIENKNNMIFNEFKETNNLDFSEDLSQIEGRLVNKNNSELFDKMVINYLRFYKNQNDNYKTFFMNKETIIYLGLHVMVLLIVMVI